jgi:hypothetical protein
MTTLQLPWTEMFIGDSHVFADDEFSHKYVIAWHTAGTTLYVKLKEKIIDIRVEREVYKIQVSWDFTQTDFSS